MWGGPSVFSLAEQNVVDVGQVVNESRLGCAVRVVLLEPLDSTSSLTVLGDGYVVAGRHTVSIVKDSSRSAEVSAKDIGRRSGEDANQLVASHGNVVARGSTEAVDDEEEVLALVRDHQGHVLCVDDVWWDLADLGRAVVAALVDIGTNCGVQNVRERFRLSRTRGHQKAVGGEARLLNFLMGLISSTGGALQGTLHSEGEHLCDIRLGLNEMQKEVVAVVLRTICVIKVVVICSSAGSDLVDDAGDLSQQLEARSRPFLTGLGQVAQFEAEVGVVEMSSSQHPIPRAFAGQY